MKIRKTIPVTIVFVCIVLHSVLLQAQVRLPGFVCDSMIIQRDVKLKIWGWASKGEKVAIRFNGRNFKATADASGKWLVWMPALKAGGPYAMDITASNKITIKNILAGDVWLCSGQSNMVHYLELHKERYADEIAKANNPEIRQFLVPTLTNLQGPAEDLPAGHWRTATPEYIRRFSVVAYFFAKDLYEKYHVPIGIINASVGGTPIEAWTSEEGLKEFPELVKTIQHNKDTAYVNITNRRGQRLDRERAKRKPQDKGLTEAKVWYDNSYVPRNWHSIHVPGYWEDQGIKDLNGVVWYRREIEVPASMTGVPAKIALGRIVDADVLYVNGVQAGNTTYQYPQRRYTLAPGVLKSGENILVVRVTNNSGKGGFVPDKPYYLAAGKDTIDLKGEWKYKVGEAFVPETAPAVISIQNQPTALFNGMVAPFVCYALKGVVWYQGESNADRADEYKELLRAFIADWRTRWRQENLPFLCVQLPDFMEMNYLPSESNWAKMREAEMEALNIPNTGMAVTIGLGEWNDIHPGNKKPIGQRLALAARKVAYGDNTVVYSGPLYQSSRVEGNTIVVTFTQAGSGLTTTDGEPLAHFAIAGADKKFVWGSARIENNTVVVWSDSVPQPLYVRYAWADNPQGANLCNREQLPASPFRTDK